MYYEKNKSFLPFYSFGEGIIGNYCRIKNDNYTYSISKDKNDILFSVGVKSVTILSSQHNSFLFHFKSSPPGEFIL